MQFLAKLNRFYEPFLWFAGLLLLWEITVRAADVSAQVLPPPSAFLARIYEIRGELFYHSLMTTKIVLYGFFWGAVPGIFLGYLIANYKLAEKLIYPMVVFIQGLPKITLAPLMLVWFGFTDFPKVLLTALVTFFPILVDSVVGFKSVDYRHYYLSKSTGSTWWQTFWKFQLPSALPSIFSGFKITIVIAVTVVIVVEWLNSKNGIGYFVLRAMKAFDVTSVFAALVVGSLIGVLLSYLIVMIENYVIPWRRR
ncbi:ABC transporter permease [Pararhizobium sp. IMCC21322]|uniref:ABC transporter permease n=1 Tax=Pararhizobium sp. IMCC21322 TaxID=3067903 RepID=UPI002740B8DB|nr:ABC transporter permease [Pararhizobium sp. IMCC21322]